jgi:transposase
MKLKMQDKQNQLIQRVSDQHLVVGIGIAQQVFVRKIYLTEGVKKVPAITENVSVC